MNKIFLENLPHTYGVGKNKNKNKLIVDWKKSIGYTVNGIYKDLLFSVKIIKYENSYLHIKYLDKPLFKIFRGNFERCALGKLLEKVTNDFKIQVGDIIKNNNRNLTIIDKKYKERIRNNKKEKVKYYKYKCNICGFDCTENYKKGIFQNDYWIEESSLLNNNNGCACCNSNIVVKGINDMWTTNPDLARLLVNPEDGYKYTQNSSIFIDWKCSICGNIIKNKQINKICQTKLSCPNCSDGISYPEKIIYNVLNQLNKNFVYQLTKKRMKWVNTYRYDFYFEYNNEKYIIEAHGLQHYKEGFVKIKTPKHIKTLAEEQKNDKLKKELALINNIKEENYIVIDCRYSELEYIKNNILHSNLNKIFDLSKIDWLKCHEFSCKSRVKEACNLWNNKKDIIDICKILKLSKGTIIKYLQQGNTLNWCSYNPKEEIIKSHKKTNKNGKRVEVFKDNISLGLFDSCSELSRQSQELFGIKLLESGISAVCRKKYNTYKNFIFKYVYEI